MQNRTDKFIIFSVNGGAGKNIAATAVVAKLKQKYPDWAIVVVTAWKDIWLYNPNVYRSYDFGNAPYFYDNYIKNKKVKIFSQDPYHTEDYLLKKKHLISIWAELCELEDDFGNEYKPELFFNQREIEFVTNNITRGDDIFVLQTHGGGDALNKHSWMRDLPITLAQEIVNNFLGRARIIHLRREDQLPLDNTEMIKGSIREILLTIRFSKYRLFIDSVCQHAAAAMGKSSVVTWVRNQPDVLGYAIHDNVVTQEADVLASTDWSLFEPYDIGGQIRQCPFPESTVLFDTKDLVKRIMERAS